MPGAVSWPQGTCREFVNGSWGTKVGMGRGPRDPPGQLSLAPLFTGCQCRSFPPPDLAPAGPCCFILLKQMVLNALTLKNTSGFPSHKSNMFAVETSGNTEKDKNPPVTPPE